MLLHKTGGGNGGRAGIKRTNESLKSSARNSPQTPRQRYLQTASDPKQQKTTFKAGGGEQGRETGKQVATSSPRRPPAPPLTSHFERRMGGEETGARRGRPKGGAAGYPGRLGQRPASAARPKSNVKGGFHGPNLFPAAPPGLGCRPEAGQSNGVAARTARSRGASRAREAARAPRWAFLPSFLPRPPGLGHWERRRSAVT